jgi:hypothetical protein
MKTLAHERDKAEILQRLTRLRVDSTRQWGRMTAHQMVCHLSDSFLGVIGRRPISPASGLFERTVIKWMALYLPMRWPRGIQTRPEVDQTVGGTKPTEFAADVAQLELLIGLVAAQRNQIEWQSHPIFGPLSVPAWMRWAYLHCDHHLRQFGV